MAASNRLAAAIARTDEIWNKAQAKPHNEGRATQRLFCCEHMH
ncbi:hypothetical protein [Pseudomonas sp. Hp2]|nr:hypothetical protein [Pseudomonas sp. Hp2]